MVRVAWNKGKSWPESVKKRISKSRKGIAAWNKDRAWSEQVRAKISASKKGQAPWNKGKSWSETTKKRISESKKGLVTWNKGRFWTDEIREKISNAKRGQTAWNKGLSWPTSVRRKISRSKLSTTLDLKPFYERNQPSKRFRFLVFQRDGFKCQYCGRLGIETVLEVDRKIPGSKGGNYTLDNSITACIDCNRGKADLNL